MNAGDEDSAASLPVASPCIGICTINQAQHCTGCGRTLDEISAWPGASEHLRRQIRERAAGRLRDTPPASN